MQFDKSECPNCRLPKHPVNLQPSLAHPPQLGGLESRDGYGHEREDRSYAITDQLDDLMGGQDDADTALGCGTCPPQATQLKGP